MESKTWRQNMDVSSTTAIIVNYNTPELLVSAVKSIRTFYKIPILVVDGSNLAKHEKMMEMIYGMDVDVHHVGKNLTHGPGLKYGMERISTKYALTMDSDAQIIEKGLLEKCISSMEEDSYGAGTVMNIRPNIKYLHPFCSLIQMSVATKYTLPIGHGAPMIRAMTEIRDCGRQHILKDIGNIGLFVSHKWKGTKGPGTWPTRA